MFLTETKYLEL